MLVGIPLLSASPIPGSPGWAGMIDSPGLAKKLSFSALTSQRA